MLGRAEAEMNIIEIIREKRKEERENRRSTSEAKKILAKNEVAVLLGKNEWIEALLAAQKARILFDLPKKTLLRLAHKIVKKPIYPYYRLLRIAVLIFRRFKQVEDEKVAKISARAVMKEIHKQEKERDSSIDDYYG